MAVTLRNTINFIGDVSAESGLSHAAELTLQAMQYEKIPVCFQSVLYESHPRANTKLRYAYLQKNTGNISLIFYNINEFPQISDTYLNHLTKETYRIGYWVWEMPYLPYNLAEQIARVDEIWTPSVFTQKIFQKYTQKPVYVIPHPVLMPPATNRMEARALLSLPQDRYIYLYTFSALSSELRKNPFGVIRAFMRAFPERDDTTPLLCIKAAHIERFPSFEQDLDAAVAEAGGIVLKGYSSQKRLETLINSVDCYVSLHRTEGFGLGMAEAMAAGKPVIATAYSGNLEFMNRHNSFLTDYRLRSVSAEDYRYFPELELLYEPGQVVAEPDIANAAHFMQYVYQQRDAAAEIGDTAAVSVQSQLHPKVIGAKIFERLQQITDSLPNTRRNPVRRFVAFPENSIPNYEDPIYWRYITANHLLNDHANALDYWEKTRQKQLTLRYTRWPVVGKIISFIIQLLLLQKLLLRLSAIEQITFAEMKYLFQQQQTQQLRSDDTIHAELSEDQPSV